MPAHRGEGAAQLESLLEQTGDVCGKALSEQCLQGASVRPTTAWACSSPDLLVLVWPTTARGCSPPHLLVLQNSLQGLPLYLTWCLRRVQFGLVHVSAGDLLREEVALSPGILTLHRP